MVVLTKIYTKTGDDGTTSLGSGQRVLKTDLRIKAYGTVDETNASIGLAVTFLGEKNADIQDCLIRIQNDLFDLGADLCVPASAEPLPYTPLRVHMAQVERLEHEIDAMNAEMKSLTSFVLPGGTQAAAALHLSRTICRRAERAIIELCAQPDEVVSEPVRLYINRLSDHLFVTSRYVNEKGTRDVLWQPGKNA